MTLNYVSDHVIYCYSLTCMKTGSSVTLPGMVSRNPSIAVVVRETLSSDKFTEHLRANQEHKMLSQHVIMDHAA